MFELGHLLEREELGSNILHLGGRRYDGHLLRKHVRYTSGSYRISAPQRIDAKCHSTKSLRDSLRRSGA
jgi:hypothetical protein